MHVGMRYQSKERPLEWKPSPARALDESRLAEGRRGEFARSHRFQLVREVIFRELLSRQELFFFQAEDGIRDVERSRGLGDVYKRQAVGCMAERYGNELAEALPEADAILGFDDYTDISLSLIHI